MRSTTDGGHSENVPPPMESTLASKEKRREQTEKNYKRQGTLLRHLTGVRFSIALASSPVCDTRDICNFSMHMSKLKSDALTGLNSMNAQ